MIEKLIESFKDTFYNRYELKPYLLPQKTKFALILPGGGYSFVCGAYEGFPVAKELNRLGYSAFVLRYRTKKKGRFPAPQDDVARALKFILSNADVFNVEKENFSIWGGSAGGHLAASFGTDNMGYKNYNLPKPALLVLMYPVITMGKYTHEGSFQNLFGNEKYRAFGSVEKQVTPDYPATYVWCCEGDDVVPQQNTEFMIEALKKNGVPYIGKIIPEIKKGHGIAIGKGTNAEGWAEEAIAFWEKQSGGENG